LEIAILAVFAIFLYQAGKWVVFKAIPSRTKAKAGKHADVAEPPLLVVTVEDWERYETPTFIRRGIPFPVLKEKARREAKRRKPKQTAPGDWILLA